MDQDPVRFVFAIAAVVVLFGCGFSIGYAVATLRHRAYLRRLIDVATDQWPSTVGFNDDAFR
jgi:hypothetical protein